MIQFLDARLPDRFWSKCMPEPNSGCWLWIAGLSSNGYGQFSIERTMRASHRVSYLSLVGSIPTGHEIDHLCRNRCCVNPNHLEAVTKAVNIQRGEACPPVRRGELHHHSHSSDEEVEQARVLHLAGWTGKEIAARFGVGRSTVSRWIRSLVRSAPAIDMGEINKLLESA